MTMQFGRYVAARPSDVAEGWVLERITPVSRLYGANGMRTGADGRLYVAQVSGSQISAVDPETGAVEAVSPMGGDIVAPDDLVFDEAGNLYATEITEGRVSVREPNGRTRVLYGDIPVANPITWHQGRLIAGECRPGGRIMELDLHGGAPRILLENVQMPNAFEVGPDGKLYFPVMGANEIWRMSLEGGAPEVVARDLGVPDSVKFDSQGRIVSTQVHSGQVLRIDVRTGEKEVLADICPGLDNVTFVGDRIFVSSISGQINEVLPGGKLRSVVPDGFNWPLGLAMGEDGVLFVADGPFCYHLRPGGKPELAAMLFTPGCPGYTRGVATSGPGELVVTTANGQVARWKPREQSSEYLAEGLKEPMGVAVDADGTVYVSECHAGRVVKLKAGRAETVLDGLKQPQGILLRGGKLYVVDALAKALVEYNVASGVRRVIAANLPVGAPPGITPKFLGAIQPLSGPMGPFAGIAAGADGTLYVSADAEGSVLAIRPA